MSLLTLLRPVGAAVSHLHFWVDRLRLKKLMQRGLRVGKNVYIMEGVEFDRGYPYLIEIGDNCRIAKGVRILAHDATTFKDLGVTRLAPVRIMEESFVGERVIILPGVSIGPRALIAAGSVVNRNIGEGQAAAGNPARPYGTYADLLKKYTEAVRSSVVFRKAEFEQGVVTEATVREALQSRPQVFVRGVPEVDPYYVNVSWEEIRSRADRAFARCVDNDGEAAGDFRIGRPEEEA